MNRSDEDFLRAMFSSNQTLGKNSQIRSHETRKQETMQIARDMENALVGNPVWNPFSGKYETHEWDKSWGVEKCADPSKLYAYFGLKEHEGINPYVAALNLKRKLEAVPDSEFYIFHGETDGVRKTEPIKKDYLERLIRAVARIYATDGNKDRNAWRKSKLSTYHVVDECAKKRNKNVDLEKILDGIVENQTYRLRRFL